MHELTRVRAYARLIVAIAGDNSAGSDARSEAIDIIVSNLMDTTPADTVCRGGWECDDCRASAVCECGNRPTVRDMFGGLYCGACA